MWTFDYIVEMTKRYLLGINKNEGDTGEPELPVEQERRDCAKLLVAYKLERERLKNNPSSFQDRHDRDPQAAANPADMDPDGIHPA